MNKSSFIFALIPLLWVFTGCQTPKDYSQFRKYHPESVLVLPPLNDSVEETASYSYLSTVSQPLGEHGYYVYSVAVVDHLLKENGMPTPGEMHQVSLDKIDEIIGADTVLYIVINDYGSKYYLINSSTKVSATARLVDVKTGEELWSDSVTQVVSSSDSGGGIVGMLVSAAVTQVLNTATDAAHDVSRMTNQKMFTTSGQGLLYGPLHKKFQTEKF